MTRTRPESGLRIIPLRVLGLGAETIGDSVNKSQLAGMATAATEDSTVEIQIEPSWELPELNVR